MSFDLALSKGDLAIGADGDLRKVRNTEKVTQDILKVLHTPLGGNPYFPTIGNALTSNNIGDNLNDQFAQARVESSVSKAVQIVQDIQRDQEQRQVLTPAEKILQVESSATLDPQEPRQYNIDVLAITGATSISITTKLALTTIIGESAA